MSLDRINEADDIRDWLLRLAEEALAAEGSLDSAHDIDHVERTMVLAQTIQAQEGGDLPTILAAVAFHDIGQERERREGGDHAVIGAEMAAGILADTRFPQNAIPAVQLAIREHRMTGGVRPQTLEGRITYDADKIDSLGAIGVARLYCMTGLLGQKVYAPTPENLFPPVDPATLRQMRKSRSYAPNIEFDLLLADVPNHLLTSTGHAMARDRQAYMRAFFDQLQQEACVVGP